MKSYVKITKDELPQLERAIRELSDTRVLVGIPQETSSRAGSPITNADLGYIHNFGAPEANIPQREFMAPGVISVLPAITDRLRSAAVKGISGDYKGMDAGLQAAGTIAQNGIKRQIQSNIPPPLALSTVEGRIRRRKSPSWRKKRTMAVAANLAAGKDPAAGLFTALIDTAGMINSITWVLRRLSTGADRAIGAFKKSP